MARIIGFQVQFSFLRFLVIILVLVFDSIAPRGLNELSDPAVLCFFAFEKQRDYTLGNATLRLLCDVDANVAEGAANTKLNGIDFIDALAIGITMCDADVLRAAAAFVVAPVGGLDEDAWRQDDDLLGLDVVLVIIDVQLFVLET